MPTNPTPLVGILIGSKSDWDIMQYCAAQLEDLNVPWEAQAISAHLVPDALFEYLSTAVKRGLEIIIAQRAGFSVINRSNAGRRSCRDVGHWPARGDQCGFAGGVHPWPQISALSPGLRRIPEEPDGPGA